MDMYLGISCIDAYLTFFHQSKHKWTLLCDVVVQIPCKLTTAILTVKFIQPGPLTYDLCKQNIGVEYQEVTLDNCGCILVTYCVGRDQSES